ncbi:MAG: 4Fe-4S dicluster domain-containing protein [Chloroflexi bacterium]|nr:4Fe-4S dicluster domain-containing protein [Chloroflexota bacterium]
MAIKDGLRPAAAETPEPDLDSNGSSKQGKNIPAPYFGRTARVVADWESVDASETPHEKNKRGELGKPLFNWYFNRTGPDALTRIAFPMSSADRRNTLQNAVARSTKGTVNSQLPQAVESSSPEALSLHIKKVAEHFGANVIGIASVHPSMLYSGDRYPEDGTGSDGRPRGEGTPEAMAEKYPYAICLSTAWDYNMIQAHRHHIGDHAYHFSQARLALVYANVAAYIREMGYEAIQNRVQPMPTALAAGVGELGRNGMLITEKYGARIHLGDPILTNMPLVADKPIDIGVDDFCKVCRKCATTCPTNSISMEDKVVHNGVEKYKINWEQCYRLRAYVSEFWETCLTCVTVCPYTKPRAWWHDLAVQTLIKTPLSLRWLTVRGLKFLDDTFWGTVPKKRVKWVGYDSGIIPVKKKQNAAADGKAGSGSNGHGELPDPKSKVGYYYPLKENTRRFEIMKEREEKAARSK